MERPAECFRRNRDGSWTCIAHATLQTPKGRIQVTEGSRFYPGTRFMGLDMAKWLESQRGDRAKMDASASKGKLAE